MCVRKRESLLLLPPPLLIGLDSGRIAWQEFKGGGDITEGGIMVLVERDKRNCSEPQRTHRSLKFFNGEPKEGEKG